MVSHGLHFWDIAGDLVQIFLCLTILFFFIRNRHNQKITRSKKTINQPGESFNQQVFTQAVEQQIDQTFTNIMESLTAERDNLESLLGIKHQTGKDAEASNQRSGSRMRQHPVKNPVSRDLASDDQRHEKIRKFSARGLSARKISNELKIPLNEVELVLSLQQK